jgi:tetratricopeptide (TPR) repeat protein
MPHPSESADLAGPNSGWPVRSGVAPPLARAINARVESAPALDRALVPGGAVILVPEQAAKAQEWQSATGKTQLAAYAARSLGWPGGLYLVAWVTAASRASVLSGYAEAAERLGLDRTGDAEAVAARFAAWLRSTTRPWLVVLDDLRDPADLTRLWPTGPSGRLIVTADDPEAGGGRARVLPVGCFATREAVAYLSERLSTDPDHRAGALDLALELGGEPAALAHAGAVIETSELTCRDYQEIFRRRRALIEQAGTGRVPAAAVTWTMSAEHAEIIGPGGGTWPLLVLAALLSGHGIPLAVLTAPATCQYLGAGDGPTGVERVLAAARALGSAGLLDLDRSGASPVAWMSAALQASVRAAAATELIERAIGAAADALLEAWPKDQPGTPLAAMLRSSATSLLRAGGDALWAGGRCHQLLLTTGHSLNTAGLAGPAAAWWQELTERSIRVLGERHADTIMMGGQLADALLTAGQAADSVTWSEWVLAERARVFGPDHRATIVAQAGLGRALTAAGRPLDAIPLLEEAARHAERVCGPGDDITVSAVEENAAACQAAGRPGDAARLLKRALAAREKARGREDPAALATGRRLAAAYLAAEQFRDAIGQYEKVLTRCERALGRDHLDTLAVRADLARACATAGNVGAALHRYQQAAAGYEQALGPDSPATLACQGELARAYYNIGDIGDATKILRAAIATASTVFSPDDPAARSLRDLLDDITDDMTAG